MKIFREKNLHIFTTIIGTKDPKKKKGKIENKQINSSIKLDNPTIDFKRSSRPDSNEEDETKRRK